MSKSGLYAHFGSKEELQLATIDAAQEIFDREVVARALEQPPGITQVLAGAISNGAQIAAAHPDRRGMPPRPPSAADSAPRTRALAASSSKSTPPASRSSR